LWLAFPESVALSLLIRLNNQLIKLLCLLVSIHKPFKLWDVDVGARFTNKEVYRATQRIDKTALLLGSITRKEKLAVACKEYQFWMSSILRNPDIQQQLFPLLPKGQEDVDGLSKEIDNLLTRELQSLSIQNRTKVQEEVHGVATLCPEENPAMIEEALKSFQQHLDDIQDKYVYDQLSPFSYLHTREWNLKFLRCELYDCKMAAERLVRFTEYMHQEYDLEVLERPLRLSDLETKCGPRGKEVINSFKSGHTQLLPFRDRSGRRVMTSHFKAMSYDAEIRVGSSAWFWWCCSMPLLMAAGLIR
jgi:hypothetical protein